MLRDRARRPRPAGPSPRKGPIPPLTRRGFLKTGVCTLSAAALGPGILLRSVAGARGAPPRNLLLVELDGGNDGLNTIVPWGVDGGAYYTEYRPTLSVPEPQVLKVPGAPVGFHPSLAQLKAHYDAGRLAVVQGVSYPNPSFSHDTSMRIWHTGWPASPWQEGWLARYLNLHPTPAFPSALEVFDHRTLLTGGTDGFLPAAESFDDVSFPSDGLHPGDAGNRKDAYAAIAAGAETSPDPLGSIAATSSGLVDLIDAFSTIAPVPYVGTYPPGRLGRSLRLVVRLLVADVGLRTFHLGYGGFDTHDDQDVGGYHAGLLARLSLGLDALHADLVANGLADDTLVVVFSEFGRTVYQNGSHGSDHGSVNPVLVFGNGVNGGFATSHPSLDPGDLTPDAEPAMVADFRDVFGTVLL
ncbi:MAG: DUF1501 domain-containing protein, partial [Planctomycetota bacterium]